MYQKVIIVGNLGQDPELRYMDNGTAVCNFSVATNRSYTQNPGTPEANKVTETTWFRVAVWNNADNRGQAEPCNEYLAKGSRVLVEARLEQDKETGGPKLWTAQDGTIRASYELRSTDVRFLGDSNGATQHGPPLEGSTTPPVSGTPAAQEEDEIPF